MEKLEKIFLKTIFESKDQPYALALYKLPVGLTPDDNSYWQLIKRELKLNSKELQEIKQWRLALPPYQKVGALFKFSLEINLFIHIIYCCAQMITTIIGFD